MDKAILAQLPKVDTLLQDNTIEPLIEAYGRKFVKEKIQEVIATKRQEILANPAIATLEITTLINDIQKKCQVDMAPTLRPVINATGVVLHTNLGRAKLSGHVQENLQAIAFGYSNLEYELTAGKRGSRYQHLEADLLKLTGAEAALVVNNNAAAVLLALQTFIQGKEIIISRGELVEIGGSFRIPDIIALSGGTIREVGTTNKTHFKDYQEAINEQTGAILKVHTSNYKIVGFTETPTIEELALLARSNDIPLMNDLGSGLLIDLTPLGFPYEPTVKESLASGCDLVTFSGDKLLGGPQAGIIVGKKKYIEQMKANQLTRALRVDKMTLSALELTLKEYLNPDTVMRTIPTLKMLSLTIEELTEKAEYLSNLIREKELAVELAIVDGFSQVGGGAYPGEQLPTKLVSLQAGKQSVELLESNFRAANVPMIVRIKENAIQFDVRTIEVAEMVMIADQLAKLV